MNIKVNTSELLEAAKIIAAVAPTRHARPLLQNVKIQPRGKTGIELMATDLQVGVRHRLTVESLSDGKDLIIPAHTFASILSEIDCDTVEIMVSESKATIKAKNSRFTLNVAECADDEFPELPKFPSAKTFDGVSWSGEQLAEALSRVVFAVAREDSRYAINGVLMDVKGRNTSFVATDGRRLAVADLKGGGKKWQAIIPIKMSKEMAKRAAAMGDGPVEICTQGNQILAQFGDTVMVGRIVEGNFPKYDQVMPSNLDRKVVFDTKEFCSSLKLAQMMTTETSKGVKIDLKNEKGLFESSSAGIGSSSMQMNVDYDGPDLSLSFDPSFLLDGARAIGGESLTVEVKDEKSPIMMRYGDEYSYVIMPMTTR